MAEEMKAAVPKRRGWLRWLGIIFGVLIVLLVVAWFVGTSGWFLKTIILPKVSTAMNARVTVDDASISPFSAVTLRNLKVETKGPDPLLTAQEVRARYSLMDIIKGNINVSEVAMESPVVNLVTFADDSSNLDPITKNPKKEKEQKPKPEKTDQKPPQVNLQKFALNNATVRKIDQHKDGTRQLLELSGLTVTADQIGNNKSGKVGLAANIRLDQGLNTASNGVLAAKVNGGFDLVLDDALKPKSAKGQTRVDVGEAKGAFAQAAALGVLLNADLTPTQLNDVSLRFSQSGNNLGALTVNGPFDAEKMEGKLNVVLAQIDKQVLNLAGAAMGIDFNQTTINSTNTIELSQRGRMVAVNGQLLVGTMSLTQKGQTTPPLDIRATYGVTYDQTNKTALVQAFALNGAQQGNEFLRGTLAKPMLLDLGKSSNAVDESAFDLVITNFNLPDWKAFAGTNVALTSGKLGLTLNLLSRKAGKDLSLNMATRLNGLSAAAGSNRIDNADISLDARGTVVDFSAVNLEQYRAALARGGQQAFGANGALKYNTKSQDADVEANVDVSLPQVASLVVVQGMNLQSGAVKFAGHILQKNTTPQQTNSPVLDRAVTGKLSLSDLTGTFKSNRFDRFATDVDVDVAMHGQAIDIRKLVAALQHGGGAAGTLNLSGNYNTGTQDADLSARIVDLALARLAPIAGMPGLALTSGTISFDGHVVQKNTTPDRTTNALIDRAVSGKLNLSELTGAFQSNRFDRFTTAVDLDVAMHGPELGIKKCTGTIQQSGQAGGAFDLSGTCNTDTKAAQLSAKLTDLNQNALKSFVANALGEKQLETITINASTTAKIDNSGDGAVKAEVHVANLVVNDPSGAVPHTPLAVDLNADVAMAKKVIDLKAVQLGLTKTDRAPNTLNIAGRIDTSKSNAYTGNVKITSEGLDVTPYYELFAGKKTNATQTAKTGPAGPAQPSEQKPAGEPAPVKLPVSQFMAELVIAKLFLREIAISNLMSKTVIDNGKANINPFSLSLNGAPMSFNAALNLGVPGYEYDVNANLDHVPLEPVVNTFQPEKRGQMKGDLIVGTQIKGAGVTGANLQKHLQGNVALVLTNGDVQVSQYKWIQRLLQPLSVALASPELAQSPLRWIDARIGIGNGTITLTNTMVESSLFRAGLSGNMTIAEVLTNSTFNELPVDLEFRKALVGKIKYLPTTATSGDFVALPHFYSIGGTLGKPDPHVDKTALAKIAAGEVLKNVKIGGDAGRLLNNLGLGGTAGGTTNASGTTTNAPATGSGNLLQGLGGLLQKAPVTNSANTNAPAPRKRSPFDLNNLLK